MVLARGFLNHSLLLRTGEISQRGIFDIQKSLGYSEASDRPRTGNAGYSEANSSTCHKCDLNTSPL